MRDIANDPDDRIIVQAILAKGRSMKLHVLAEGVETEAQLGILSQDGCEAFRGYLFGRPVPIEDWELATASRRASLSKA